MNAGYPGQRGKSWLQSLNFHFRSLSEEIGNQLVLQKIHMKTSRRRCLYCRRVRHYTIRKQFFWRPWLALPKDSLQPAPGLGDATNSSRQNHAPPAKVAKLTDLNELSLQEIEETWGLKLKDTTEFYPLAGRGSNFTSSRLRRSRNQPVKFIRESPHSSGQAAITGRGALPRPAPSWCFTCNVGIHCFMRGAGHGKTKDD